MQKKWILIPLCFGLALIVYGWHASYPLLIDTPLDFIFNHVSPWYWVGLSIVLGSLYLGAVAVKNHMVKLLICILIVLSMYSIRYYYYLLPSSDAQYVRGLTEYAMATGDLDAAKPHHSYFQWPLFFILNDMAISITGLALGTFEFLLFAVFGVVYVAALYFYSTRYSEGSSYAAVIVYFIIMYWFLNYQFAPFSLAMALLFVLFMLESRGSEGRSTAVTLAIMVLFTAVNFMHPFAGVLFIAYVFVLYLLNRNASDLQLFVFTLVIYLAVSIFFAGTFFLEAVRQLATAFSAEYQRIIERTFASRIALAPPIDSIAQMFSRAIVLVSVGIAGAGFLFLLLKKKLKRIDLSVMISMSAYAAAGIALPVLGSRAWFAVLIPVALGVIPLVEKFKGYLKSVLLILLILFPLIPLTESFSDTQTFFQTRNEYDTADFLLQHYNWSRDSSILSHFRVMTYLEGRSAAAIIFGHDLSSTFPEGIGDYNCIIYTVGLGKNLLLHEYSIAELEQSTNYSRTYDSGACYIITRASNSRNVQP